MPEDPRDPNERFPSKLYVTRVPDEGFIATTALEGDDGDEIAVYRLCFRRKLVVSKHLSLKA